MSIVLIPNRTVI